MTRLRAVAGVVALLAFCSASIHGDSGQVRASSSPEASLEALPGAGADMPGRTLYIQVRVDGSNVLDITHDSMTWTDLNWGPPKDLKINGMAVDYATIHNTPLPPALAFLRTADFRAMRVLRRAGRDTVAVEPTRDHLRICFADTPNGPDDYEIKVGFPIDEKPPKASDAAAHFSSASLHIKARIDGSDVLRLSHSEMTWVHGHWGPPRDIEINGTHYKKWEDIHAIPLEGNLAFLRNAEFSSFVVTRRSGRDTIAVEPAGDHVDIHFADNPLGLGDYELELKFRIK